MLMKMWSNHLGKLLDSIHESRITLRSDPIILILVNYACVNKRHVLENLAIHTIPKLEIIQMAINSCVDE